MKDKANISKQDRQKVNYLRNFPLVIHNDVPGGYLVFIIPGENECLGCGLGFTLDVIDKAIAYAEIRNPEITRRLKAQLSLF